MASLNAREMAMRPRWSEYKILACDPTTFKGERELRVTHHDNNENHSETLSEKVVLLGIWLKGVLSKYF